MSFYLGVDRYRVDVIIWYLKVRGHSSVGRASALHAGGQEFESPCLHAFRVVHSSMCNIFYVRGILVLLRNVHLCNQSIVVLVNLR